MRRVLALLVRELWRTARQPRRVLSAFDKGLRRKYANEVAMKLRGGGAWEPCGPGDSFRRRAYASYRDYVTHQKLKLDLLVHDALPDYDVKYRAALRERLERLGLIRRGMNTLCLAARIGTEVKAFLDLGAFAVGIDLNPGPDNPYVVVGDFHNLQFPSESADAVFTNSLDHVFDLPGVLSEVKRVLKPGALLIVEAGRGTCEGTAPRDFESFSWSTIDALVSLLENTGLKLINRLPFDYPWDGEQLCFRNAPHPAECLSFPTPLVS